MSAKELTIRVASVSPNLTRMASRMILNHFSGFFMSHGIGGYVSGFKEIESEESIQWRIGTSSNPYYQITFLERFASMYCRLGKQESVYMVDSDGFCHLGFAYGPTTPLA